MPFDPKHDTLDWVCFDTEIARDIEPSCLGRDEHERRGEAFRRMMKGEGGMSVAVLWDSRSNDFELYDESTVGELADALEAAPVVAVFNKSFDTNVVGALAGRQLNLQNVIDPLSWVRGDNGKFLKGSRLALLSEWNLGRTKSGCGKDAYMLYKEGRIAELYRYCRHDVELLRDLVYHIRDFKSIVGPNGLIDLSTTIPDWMENLA